MSIVLAPLPYDRDALEPYISRETLSFHYDKHHQTYVTNLNNLIADTPLASQQLEEIITTSSGGVFNNAAQIWNHNIYWNCIGPNGGGEPTGDIKDAIDESFGNFSNFREEFTKKATTVFGSGWAWLVQNADGKLEVITTANAGNPLSDNSLTTLLGCDVWEHAYYIDYRNARPKYLEGFFQLIQWDFLSNRLR